jgi:hypothetical protein
MYDGWDRFADTEQAAIRGQAAGFIASLPGKAEGYYSPG